MAPIRDLVLGTAGHIDHGKTALVHALTGVDTDRLPAEKERGITIDLGFAALELGELRLALIDVPGHERFVRNMLAGASGIDLAMLVVAADDSVMPQTREHLEILKLLGLKGGLIALTKCDLADESWLDLVEDDVRALVRGSFLEAAPIVRTAAISGRGIDELKQALKTLGDNAPIAADAGLFRMAVDRSFSVQGHGTVVTGTVASGSLTVGDELVLWPLDRPVRVRGMQRHDRPVEAISRGMRAAINLGGIRHTEIVRGYVLATPGYLTPTRIVTIEIQASLEAPRPLRHRARYRLHIGSAEVAASLSLFDRRELAPGEATLGQLHLAEPIVTVYGEPFVLREESPPATLGGGRILQPSVRRIRRRDSATIDRVRRLQDPDPVVKAVAALAFYAFHPWTEATLARDSGIPLANIPSILSYIDQNNLLVELPTGPRRASRVLAEVVADLEDRTIRAIARLHASKPRHSTIPRSQVAAALADLQSDSLVAGLIDRLDKQKRVVATPRSVALVGHTPKLSQGERKLMDEIVELYHRAGFNPPELEALAERAGPRSNVVPELIAILVEEERLVSIGGSLYLDEEIARELVQRVTDRLSQGGTITMSELRDLLGTTRKFAVPIGEYLDRIGVTKREGDARGLARPREKTAENARP